MAEPTSTSSAGIVAVSIALLGPIAGEYAVIVFSALAGSLWALSRETTLTRWDGAVLVFRLVLTAGTLASFFVWLLEHYYQWPSHQMLAPVAFGIGAVGNGWPGIVDRVKRRVLAGIGVKQA